MMTYTVALDIGGTSIKAGLVDAEHHLLDDRIDTVPALSHEAQGPLIAHLAGVIRDQVRRLADPERSWVATGLGFPAPFDYINGICRIEDQDKFRSLFGVAVGRELIQTWGDQGGGLPPLAQRPPRFVNDALAFALGEGAAGAGRGLTRLLALTLGTGLGASFLDRGRQVRGERGVPANGELWDQPYEGGLADDAFSKRGLLALAGAAGLAVPGAEVADLAREAAAGDAGAAEVFRRFGARFGGFLRPFVDAFQPEGLVLGGNIARASALFEPALSAALGRPSGYVRTSSDLSRSALIGLSLPPEVLL